MGACDKGYKGPLLNSFLWYIFKECSWLRMAKWLPTQISKLMLGYYLESFENIILQF